MPYEFSDELGQEPTKENIKNRYKECGMVRKIMRRMRLVCDSREFEMLMFIFDRTYPWDKEVERITIAQIQNGIMNDREIYANPITLSRSQIYRILARLQTLGLIFTTTGDIPGKYYGVNPHWDLDEFIGENDLSMLSPETEERVLRYISQCNGYTLKRNGYTKSRMGENKSRMGATKVSHGGDYITNKNITNENKVTGACAPVSTHVHVHEEKENMLTPKEKLEIILQEANAKHKAASTKKKSKGNASAYMTIWRDKWNAVYPDDQFFPWRVHELAAFKKALARGVPEGDKELFIDYVVEHFAAILRTNFAWMKNPPELPVVSFVTKHIEAFYRSYQEFIDPNRKVKSRLRNAEAPATTDSVRSDTDEVQKLREENEKLKTTIKKVRTKKAKGKILRAKKLRSNRTVSDEFGKWD